MTYFLVTNYILLNKSYANKTNFNLDSAHEFFYSRVFIFIFFCNPNRTLYLTILLVSLSYFSFFDFSSVSSNRSISFSFYSSNTTSCTNFFNPSSSVSSSTLVNFISSTTFINLSTSTNSVIFKFN